jgi:hypothetical protein
VARVPLAREDGGVVATFSLREGDAAVFLLEEIEAGAGCGVCLSESEAGKVFVETVKYWRRWLSKSTYQGRWREMVDRSALALKLLTFEPSGALVAAPTAGLPEEIGGERNWDYRYTWIRDAAFTLYSFLRIGQNGSRAGAAEPRDRAGRLASDHVRSRRAACSRGKDPGSPGRL